MYPLLESHPTYKINSEQLKKGGPSIIWLHVPIKKKDDVKHWVESNSNIRFETSFGDSHSKIDPWPKNGNSNIYKLTDKCVEGTWIRLSIGHEEYVEKLCQQLVKLFNKI